MAVPIDVDEVDRVARLIARVDGASAKALRHYLSGDTTAQAVMPTLRRRVKALLDTADSTMRRDVRVTLLEFGAKYGLQVRASPAGEDMLTAEVRFRVTPQMMDQIKDRAKQAGFDTYAEWCRMVLGKAAETGNDPGA